MATGRGVPETSSSNASWICSAAVAVVANDRGVLGDLTQHRRLVVELVQHAVALAEQRGMDLPDDREHPCTSAARARQSGRRVEHARPGHDAHRGR